MENGPPRPLRGGRKKPMGLKKFAFTFVGAYFLLAWVLSLGGVASTIGVLLLAAALGAAAWTRGYDSRDGRDGTDQGPWKYV